MKTTLIFWDEKISCSVEPRPFVKMVGYYLKDKPVVIYDEKLKDPAFIKLLSYHETIERHLRYHHGYTYKQAHATATVYEKKIARKIDIDWTAYSKEIERIYALNDKGGKCH